MATSIASQLQALKSLITTESQPQKRPFTRPSILFGPKEAADVDLDTLLSLALSGLEVLISTNERFRKYRNDLFSQKSRELDRELMGTEENNQINVGISSYLRLLSEYFQLPSALKTLEYLIRRYKIHVYNTEDLILCALPYHDTHIFVRIVQILDTGNSKWKFLEGVKASGAPPPRKVIVQQCTRDVGVLEVLCNYASPTKKFHPSRPVISFCTAVVVEALGSSTTIENGVVKRVLPFISSGLQPDAKGSLDHRAGALMIVGLLANGVALAPKLVKSLIQSIAELARGDAKEDTDLQWFRTSFIALINLVQLQSVEMFPQKAVDILKEIRDLSGILAGLSKEFNIDKFLAVFLESLIEYSRSDDTCHRTLLTIIETVPVKHFVNRIVSKLLYACMSLSQRKNEPISSESAYFGVMIKLMRHADNSVRRKALGLLSGTVKDSGPTKLKHERRGLASKSMSCLLNLDESAVESFKQLCLEIVKLIDDSVDDSNTSLKVAAVAALEVLVYKFPSNYSIFSMCLATVTKNIQSDNLSVSSCCLLTTGALVNALGPRALPELPHIMENVLKRSHVLSSFSAITTSGEDITSITSTESKEALFTSILLVLEAIIDKLGGFLNPYLGDILKLMVLNPKFALGSDSKSKLKANVVRNLITEKIPVRLLLLPLLSIYPEAVRSGDSSLSIAFELLGNLVRTMDRPSVASHHPKIFDLCLVALDLRRQHAVSIRNIDVVEKKIINTTNFLTMKLTETMFKPLFIRCIEWAESNVGESESGGSTSIDRAISFYGLVNKLAESHRSLFVPYFKYLLDSCIRHLTVAEDENIAFPRKKKKAKIQDANSNKDDGHRTMTPHMWHLRAMVLSSLHKCFLYDTGSLKFLDSSNFQVLLKPIVSQLVVEPPTSLEEFSCIPSIKEVDDLLVDCVGQMAVTAGTDLLWKPLNHEVLMQTRSDKVRCRILGLRIVKYLVENLKEEYLVFLAETIPFLGELLEDVELPVKSLAQEILKEMESMSGESLRQYL